VANGVPLLPELRDPPRGAAIPGSGETAIVVQHEELRRKGQCLLRNPVLSPSKKSPGLAAGTAAADYQNSALWTSWLVFASRAFSILRLSIHGRQAEADPRVVPINESC